MTTSLAASEWNARLGRLSRRVDDVSEVAWTLTSHRTREQVLSALLDLAVKTVHAEVGGIFHKDGDRLRALVSLGLDAEMAQDFRAQGQSVVDAVQSSGVPIVAQVQWQSILPNSSLRVRSLLAVPIRAESGCFGVLLLAHGRDGDEFSHDDQSAASVLATLAAVSLQNAEWLHKAVEKQRLEWQMGTARLVQRSLLPDPGCGPAWLNWESYYKPALAVGGDYFDIVPLREDAALVAVGDVSDHGISAALLMTAVRSVVRSECLRGSGPAQILRSVNRSLCEDSGRPQALLASLFVAMVEGNRRELTYANAGHPTPLCWDAARLLPAPLADSGPLLGKFKGANYTDTRLTLGPGYRLFLYSDGLTEAGNPRGELYGLPRVRQAAAEQCGLPGAEFVLGMRRQIETFSECTDPRDDLTMLWLGERATS